MFFVEKRFKFEASHYLPFHDGKCKHLHGHSWVGVVICRGSSLQETGPKQGMLLDFGTISKALDPLVETYLDHHHLNDSLGLLNPTSEEIARWVFDRIKGSLAGYIVGVRIEETCTSAAEYRP
jgi:6-pyruvoyltetrahydropterin/6-carboxytetrahydropterin synthase